MDSEPAPSINLARPAWALATKRAFDLSFVVIFLGLFWWVYVLVAVAIKLSSPGPLTYGHIRVGRSGRKFPCYKFRSMVVNSKEVLEHLLATDPAAREEWEQNFKLKNDPRITWVRFDDPDRVAKALAVVRGQRT